MSGAINGNDERVSQISRLFDATGAASAEVARHGRILRARRYDGGANQPAPAGQRAGGILIQPAELLGSDWGLWTRQPGLAHWSYGDWAENVIDSLVLRRAPGMLDLRTRGTDTPAPLAALGPCRAD